MPIKTSVNSRMMPANSRAVDVAIRAIDEITPIQQTRIANAFKPQGSQGILYNRLEQGTKCTCSSRKLNLANRMGEDGKLSDAAISSMLHGMTIETAGYAPREDATITSPFAPKNQHQTLNNDTHQNTDTLVIPLFADELVKDDGARRETTLDDLAGEFDPTIFGMSDIACPVCFGTGFVGGYAPLHTYRAVMPVNHARLLLDSGGEIDTQATPWRARVRSFTASVLVPSGIVSVDSCRVYDMDKPIYADITLNGQKATDKLFLDNAGKMVSLAVDFGKSAYFTHFEFQAATSTESAYFDLPKLPQSGDLTMLDSTNPFTVLFSPDIPRLFKQDVIVEAQYGKVLVVHSVTPWSTRQKHNLGYEAEVRVAQPQELFNILPRRGRTLSKYQTTVGSKSLSTGRYRA